MGQIEVFTGAEAEPDRRTDVDETLADVPLRRRPGSLRAKVRIRVLQLLMLAGLLLAWHLTAEYELIKPVLARGPGEVWTAMRESWQSGQLWDGLSATLHATALAFLLASVVGVAIGMALAFLPRTEQVLNPFLDAMNSMPRIALGPVFIIYFGISTSAKVALAFTIVVFILIYNARAGIRSADPDILRLSSALGANRRQLFRKVMLPVAVPAIFAGLRLGLIYSLLGVVTAEIIASRAGLGQLIMQFSGTFRLEGVYGILIILAIVAGVLNSLMQALERWILRWQAPSER